MRHALLAALLATAIALPALADPAYLTVAGQGEVSATPDQVIINAGVTSSAKTAREALAQNSQTMTSVFAALKKQGVAERAIRTANFNLSPQYAPAAQGMMAFPNDRPIIGYRVSNNVTVRLDDVSHAGTVLDALVAAGANQANGLSYVFKNDEGLLTNAREAAVKSAFDHARTYAAAAGVTLGPLHAISDTNNGFMPGYPPVTAAARFAPALAPPPPIGVGEQTLRATVTVSWEIKQ